MYCWKYTELHHLFVLQMSLEVIEELETIIISSCIYLPRHQQLPHCSGDLVTQTTCADEKYIVAQTPQERTKKHSIDITCLWGHCLLFIPGFSLSWQQHIAIVSECETLQWNLLIYIFLWHIIHCVTCELKNIICISHSEWHTQNFFLP